MTFDLSKISTERGVSPYIDFGSNQKLKINRIELVRSSTGSQKAVLHLETEPLTMAGFTPIEGHQGKVGKVSAGVYMKTLQQQEQFLTKMKMIAKALDVEDDFNQISGSDLEDVVSKIERVVSGNKYAKYTIFGEQYVKQDNKIGLRLFFPNWAFVESINVLEVETKNIKFDMENPQHFKKIKAASPVKQEDGKLSIDDLPF